MSDHDTQDDPQWVEAQIQEQAAREEAARERAERLQVAIDRFNEAQAAEIEIQEAANNLESAFVGAAVEWLQERWGLETECPYCAHNEWSVGSPFEVSLENGQSLAPHFPVVCANCGNTVFVNAVLAGLIPEAYEE